ncbi:hypothetical protein DOTSEDRAFT_151005 [Dothistroma septosporum NZE10]|uniref:F-box domain-containing protein n=1 Tax=Dothistroma septosporum (strain NZE10 / CBS 128990) TaxID=675120 RepID=N1PQU9_DOTSN|nr:hypothetical protein DOTSEDRAFT_151005 [Dothistroma septosporum NZE10]
MLSVQSASPITLDSLNANALHALPAEVLLDIIPHIPFSAHGLRCLCLTCARLNLLIRSHENSLVNDIKHVQTLESCLQLFPSLETDTFKGLAKLHKRMETLDDLHQEWLKITSNGPELDWLKGRWETIHKTGLLLLYRLQDSGSYCNKVAMLNGLPATSLACLLFKLISSIKILRIYGPNPINGTYASGDIMARSDIELAFEEMLLHHGPDFFVATLHASRDLKETCQPSSQWAIEYVTERSKYASSLCTRNKILMKHLSALEAEVSGMIDRQMPDPRGFPKPPTLTSCMRRAFAARLGCHVSQNVGKMWEVLSSTAFDEVEEGKMCQIVRGEEIEKGMKRIF